MLPAHHCRREVNRGGGGGYARYEKEARKRKNGDGEKLVASAWIGGRNLPAQRFPSVRAAEKTGGTSFPNISPRVDRFHVNYIGECAVEFVRAGERAGGEGSFKATVNLSPDSVYASARHFSLTRQRIHGMLFTLLTMNRILKEST